MRRVIISGRRFGKNVAQHPDPQPGIDGMVVDAGGGHIDFVVDRATEEYPKVGARVRLVLMPDTDNRNGPGSANDNKIKYMRNTPHHPMGRDGLCTRCEMPTYHRIHEVGR